MISTPAAQRSFVAYYRVSNTGQGESGLGLDAQRHAVSAYLAADTYSECIAELTEIESGKRKDRPQLAEAMKIARRGKATLVIARLDRLARTMNDHSVSCPMASPCPLSPHTTLSASRRGRLNHNIDVLTM